MPIPKPRKGESRDKYIPRCIKAVSSADPDRPQKQVIAICFGTWRDSKGIKKKEEIKTEEEMKNMMKAFVEDLEKQQLVSAIYKLVGEK